MADTFTKVTTKGYGTRLGESIKGMFVGFLMFVASFGLLYWNEGRLDLSLLAKQAQELDAAAVTTDAAMQEKLVSVTGEVTAHSMVGDELFLKDGAYIAVERVVEMYAWVEESEEHTNTNLGGSETTTTTYTYTKEWTSSPKSSGEFAQPEGHENPALTIEGDEFRVDHVMVGAYPVETKNLSLPGAEDLRLNKEMVSLSSGAELSGNYVFLGSGTMSAPQVGDTRVSYRVVEPGFDGTVMGMLDGDTIVEYVDEDNNKLFRLFDGSRTEAIGTLHDEHVMTTWILRLVGFLMMWMGLAALFGPIATFLDILPVFGSLTRFLVLLVTLPIAVALALVTIVVSMIVHSLVATIIAAVVVIGVVVFLLMRLKQRKQAAMVMPRR